MSTKRLMEIKGQIDEAKNKLSEVSGQIKSETDRMEQRFDIGTLKSAEKKLKEIEGDLDEKETEFKKGMSEIEESYEWD